MPPAAPAESRDKRLQAAVVQAGLASAEQVEECLAIRAKLAAAGAKKSLAEVLVQKGSVSKDGALAVQKLA